MFDREWKAYLYPQIPYFANLNNPKSENIQSNIIKPHI